MNETVTLRVPGYTSPKSYGHKLLEGLHGNPTVVQEKLDGSQFSFCKVDGVVIFRSRGKQLYTGESVDKLFSPVVQYVKSIEDRIPDDGLAYRGEAVCKPRHNSLQYDRAAKGGLVLFDVEAEGGHFKTPEEVAEIADLLGFDYAPVYRRLGAGQTYTDEMFVEDMERVSVLGGKIEGVVVKNYSRFFTDGKLMCAKVVSSEFKEIHDKQWKKTNPTRGEIVGQLIAALKTDARWKKAIQHLNEEGVLAGEPRDIGPLIKEIQRDVDNEAADYVKDRLYEHFKSSILRGVVAGFPEFYKSELGIMG